MNNFFVYILKCKDGSLYVGHTDNLDNRIAEHNGKRFKCYTSNRLPIELIYQASFTSRDEAFNAERQIKKWTRKKKMALINGKWDLLKILSKKQFQ